ncbi:MAG: hypothetical protein JRH18_01550 [Deltaproteobacteria bacterium]|nr:hypothetical protein [Deltaproteobacteria bacterium]MBW2150333.1 hypothetical protein [Deltaproteobacteria bacterium]
MNDAFPKAGYSASELLKQIDQIQRDDLSWQSGKVFGIVYYLDEALLKFSTDIFRRFLCESASKPQVWPSLKRFEDEIIGMALDLFNGTEDSVGTITSGGTESIFLAVKAARDWARSNGFIGDVPQIVAPNSAHPGFDRAAQYLGLDVVRVPVQPVWTIANGTRPESRSLRGSIWL